MKISVLLLGMFIVAGCGRQTSAPAQYQLANSSDGKVYRLNTSSGEVCLVTPDGLTPVPVLIGDKKKIGRFEVQEVGK